MENEYKIQFRACKLFWLDFKTIPDRFSLIEVHKKLEYLEELCSSNGIIECELLRAKVAELPASSTLRTSAH